MLFNEKSLRKTQFLLNLCVVFGVTLGLFKLYFDGFIYLFNVIQRFIYFGFFCDMGSYALFPNL